MKFCSSSIASLNSSLFDVSNLKIFENLKLNAIRNASIVFRLLNTLQSKPSAQTTNSYSSSSFELRERTFSWFFFLFLSIFFAPSFVLLLSFLPRKWFGSWSGCSSRHYRILNNYYYWNLNVSQLLCFVAFFFVFRLFFVGSLLFFRSTETQLNIFFGWIFMELTDLFFNYANENESNASGGSAQFGWDTKLF